MLLSASLIEPKWFHNCLYFKYLMDFKFVLWFRQEQIKSPKTLQIVGTFKNIEKNASRGVAKFSIHRP